MPPRHKRTVRPRSGKPRETITVQINPDKHRELLDWLAGKKNNQGTILNALYAKMVDEQGQDGLADTKPMVLPEMETDPAMLNQLYEALVLHMDEQYADIRLLLRGLKSFNAQLTGDTTSASELKPELRTAIKSSMRPGKSR